MAKKKATKRKVKKIGAMVSRKEAAASLRRRADFLQRKNRAMDCCAWAICDTAHFIETGRWP